MNLGRNRELYNPTIKEDFVTILPENQLRVYTKDNPMPEDALKGDVAVLEYLDQYMNLDYYRKKLNEKD